MTGQASAESEAGRAPVMHLARLSQMGIAFGLRPGDALVSVAGRPPRADVDRLRVAEAHGSEAPLLGLQRGDVAWFIRGVPADFGKWRAASQAAPRDTISAGNESPILHGASPPPDHARNWEVWETRAGDYDVFRSRPGLAEALVPYHLLKMGLWEPLALWVTLLMVSVALGGILGWFIQLLSWGLFWRVSPDLVRRDWVAQSMTRRRIVAATAERTVHETVARLDPDLRFRFAAVRPAAPSA